MKFSFDFAYRSIEGGEVNIGETKTEKGTRTILLPKGTLKILTERKKNSVSEWIFPRLVSPEKPTSPSSAYFEPYKGKIRKAGTGGIYQISDNLFEGRYSPTNAHGKREVHTVYAKTREECEKLLEEMIPKVRAEIKAEKDRLKSQNETAQV